MIRVNRRFFKSLFENRLQTIAKWCTFFILIYILKKSHDIMTHARLNKVWIDQRIDLIEHYPKKTKTIKMENSVCSIPHLDPFEKTFLPFMVYKEGTCDMQKYGMIMQDKLLIKALDEFRYVYVQYIIRGDKSADEVVSSKRNNMDDVVTLGPYIKLKKSQGYFRHTLEEDFIKISIYKSLLMSPHTEYHATLAKTRKIKLKNIDELETGLQFNVMMYMIDSLSRANFIRHMIKSLPALEDDEDTIIFNGQSIVGDGTTAALSAIFTGIAEKDLPETRRGFTRKTCDQYNMIFKDFEEKGYVTAFSEEEARFASFNFRLNGFIKPPAIYYTRPYFLSNLYYVPNLDRAMCGAQESVNLFKKIDEAFHDKGKFVFVSTSSSSHDHIDDVQSIDKLLMKTIKFMRDPKIGKNTMFVLFGDHGNRIGPMRNTLQGKLEERLPFLSISMPIGFNKKYPKLFEALKHNSNFLTSPFDLYTTFQHLLTFPQLPKQDSVGKSLFTKFNAENRTCEEAGVLEHWCPCLTYEKLDTTNSIAEKVGNEFVKYINNEISQFNDISGKCASLKLKSVSYIGKRVPNRKVEQYVKTKRNEVCDSCAVVLSGEKAENSFIYYQSVFVVSPSNGVYDANGKFVNGKLVDEPTITRSDRYGTQPWCVMNIYPHLRPYCYCV